MPDTFSIIIPVYNRESVVARALDSVAAQSFRPLHLIVVDNASTDRSLDVIRGWAEKHAGDTALHITVLSESIPGAAAARQCGLNTVTTSHVLFLDSDDALRPDAVESYAEVFRHNPGTQIICADILMHPLHGRPFKIPRRRGDRLIVHFHHCTLPTLGYAASTELLRQAGGWNRDIRIWDDWELGIRLLLLDPVTGHTGKIAVDTYESEISVTGINYSDKAPLYEAAISAVENAIANSRRPDKQKLMAMAMYRRIMLAAHFAREGRPDLSGPLLQHVLDATHGRNRALLRMAYLYIRSGLRGAATLVTPLLR